MRKLPWMILVALVAGPIAVADPDIAKESDERQAVSAGFDWSEFIQTPSADANQHERDNFVSFTEAMANESFSEAEITAKLMVEQFNTDTVYGPERARALHNLAIAQQASGNYDSAKQNYVAALGVIISSDDNLSPALVLPLRGLASALLASEQPREAFAALGRALHVSNVNHGPHSLNQLPILNSKMKYYLDQGDVASTLDVLDRIYLLYSRKYARNSEEMLPALYQRTEIYGRLKDYGEERRAWRHIMAIKQRHHAENDLGLIEPNVRLAENLIHSMRRDAFRSVSTSIAERHLKRALWIAENSPEDDWEAKKDCLLSLADFYTLFDMKGRARRYYSAAWELMSSKESYLVARAEHLELPVPISQPAPDPYANFEYHPGRKKAEQKEYLDGDMTVQFTVDDRGRTRDLRIVVADPPHFSHMEKRVRNSVKEFIYRPRMDDGRPTATRGQQYRISYYYLPSEYRASLEKSAKRSRRGQRD